MPCMHELSIHGSWCESGPDKSESGADAVFYFNIWVVSVVKCYFAEPICRPGEGGLPIRNTHWIQRAAM